MLYWFRTPPGVKVGRAALDEDAIRMLEELNPEIDFDWTRMLKTEPPPQDTRPSGPQKRQGPPPPRHPASRRDRDRPRVEPSVTTAVESPATKAADDAGVSEESIEGPADVQGDAYSVVDPAEAAEDQFARGDEPTRDADAIIEPDASGLRAPEPEEAPSLAPSAAQARLGTEGIVRLRGRYAEILARIDERITDPVKREELKTQAERLNPDAWVTDHEVQAGLEQYETAFESLRAVVGRRRRRRKRRGPRPQVAGLPGGQTNSDNVEADEPPADDTDDVEKGDDV